MIMSLTLHEYAHALVARWLGDKTAEEEGRVTLNPVSHIDPIGTLLLPLMLVASGAGVGFGWAKPVPYNPTRFDKRWNMRHGSTLVAVAGPLTNFLFAAVAVVALGLLMRFGVVTNAPNPWRALVLQLVLVNISLGFFNLLPVPPLDGSKVLWGLLSPKLGDRYASLMQQAGTFAFIAVVFLGGALIREPVIRTAEFLWNVVRPGIAGS